MRRTTILITVAMVLVFVVGVWPAHAGLSGTDHDFSGDTWSNNRICLPCHTPHNGDMSLGPPLWNHATTAEAFTVYTGFELNSSPGQPDGASKLCLGCHDGATALDSFGGTTGTTLMGAGDHNFGTDLSNDHPISMAYTTAIATADGELTNPSAADSWAAGETIAAAVLDSNNKMQCTSCHDVHNTTNMPFLRISNTGSALCLKCHTK